MESLSRPRHGRKHSRNPYGDVFLSTGPERETLDAHEYAEIFSVSSSIPVLDLSALDEPGVSRDSNLDYSTIFGGDAGEDLLNGSADKAQRRNSTDERVLSQESDSSDPNINSGEASDHSTDEPKQFNVSFNRTHQRDIDASNGKTHIAQLQATPCFTHFVDENPHPPKTDSGKNVNLLKRDVSRTWSFKADAEAIKGKGELSREKSRVPDNKAQPKASYFVPKNDVLEDQSDEFPPPFYGEEFNENSIAAASAAALKRAIDQAQESIRLAKMIMDRKKEGYQGGSKARQKGNSKVSYKEGGKDSDSKKKKMKDKNLELYPAKFHGGMNGKSASSVVYDDAFISAAKTEVVSICEDTSNGKKKESLYIDEKIELKKAEENVEVVEAGKSTPSLVYDGAFITAAKTEVESVCVNAAEGKGHELSSSNGIHRETLYIDEKIGLKKTENVEAVEVHSGGADFPVLLADECKKENLEQIVEVSVAHAQGTEVVAEQIEWELDTSSQRIQELKMNVEEGEDCKVKAEPENKVEKVVNTPQRTRRQWNVLGKARKYFGIGQEDRLSERENDMEEKVKKEPEEVTNVETEKDPERKENDNLLKIHDEGNLLFGSEEELKETLEREINPNIFLEIEEGEKSVDEVHEPEIDFQNENHAHGEDDQNLPGEVEQNEVGEKHINTSECEVPDTIETGEKHSAQVQSTAVFFDSEENRVNCKNDDDAYEEHVSEAVDVDVDSSSSSTIFSETQEACNVDLDSNPKQYQTVVESREENYTVPEVIETFSEINKDQEEENLFHQENDDKIPGSETLRRVSSEEIFVERKLHNDSDSLSSDGSKIENGSLMGPDPEEELPEDEVASNATEIDDVDQGLMSEVDLPDDHASDIRTSEFDTEGVEQVSEEASGSDESSVSTSSHENVNGFSAHDSEECEESANDMNPINGELKDEVGLVSNERKPMENEGAGGKDTNIENSKENLAGISVTKEKDVKLGDLQNSDRDDDYQQRIDAIKRGRQQEKDRKVVERAIREARERAYAEAREMAERAAVEKAAAEARQRAMSEAREKASHVKQQASHVKQQASHVKQQVVVDKDSIQAKLRAERAAVERATAEARERALKKAMSMKTTHTEGKAPEKVLGSSRSNGLKHSFSSSDLDNGTESAQRHKARLERHQRIMERAQKALAEKNMRDVLAQKEQAERNRLAESLDADIKRWAMGKEKNLRALLSTLQYILGADSGWQPIHMTDIVTTAAVKKAYRKATLCVHPDKLQQRGATIKQKYICEKVFDLLKAAWNRYESDDR